MKSPIDGLSFPITCPNCRAKFTKPLRWLESNSQMTCTCGQMFKIDPTGFRSARKTAAEFAAKISRLGRKR